MLKILVVGLALLAMASAEMPFMAAIMDSFSRANSLLRRRSDSLAHSSASLSVLPSSDMVRCDCVAFVGQLTGEDEVRSSGLCVEAT